MKTINLLDAMTGKQLEIRFDLEADKMEINGTSVERKRPLESDENQFVYGSTVKGDTKIYHLNKDQINEIRAL
jgi:hypothetical protein